MIMRIAGLYMGIAALLEGMALHVLALFLVSVQGIGRSDLVAFHKGMRFPEAV